MCLNEYFELNLMFAINELPKHLYDGRQKEYWFGLVVATRTSNNNHDERQP